MGPGAGWDVRAALTVTTVHLLRHATHTVQATTLAGRMPGLSLSDAGRAEAARLAGLPVQAVVCSPQPRARQTAGAIGAPVEVDPAWDEVDFGAWAGMAFADLDPDPAWRLWNTARSLAPTLGGETMLQVQARAVAGLLALRRYEAVAVVSHLDVLRAVLAYVLGMPLDALFRLHLAPASRSVVTLWEGGARVEGLNLPP